jgi:SAM-dependent methyltransferase
VAPAAIAAPPSGLGRAEVVAAFRWLLGRDPESEATVVSHLEAGSVEALRRRIMRSAEFRQAAGFPMAELVAEAPAASDLDATPEELQALLVRQRRSWDALGGTAPHWSCLPEPSYRPESLPLHRRDFYASGREDRLLLEGVLARLGMPADRFGHLVEFGCGVGRATLHLAAICPEVTAVDISPSHLALARAEGKARGLDHIRWLRSRPDLPVPAERADIWFSRRVLQHNPPPLIRETLWQAFATLAPGGLAVFQLLTRGAGYGFSLAACLAGRPPQQPELHVLPQREVFALATAAGLQVLEVRMMRRRGSTGGAGCRICS